MSNVVRVFDKTGSKILMDTATWLSLPWPRSLFVDKSGYPVLQVFCKEIKRAESCSLHRWVMNNPAEGVVDHINGVRHDVRSENLRICSAQQNCQNRQPVKWKKYKGVIWRKARQVWEVRLTIPNEFYSNGRNKVKFVGHFKTQEEAALAYNEAAKLAYGEFAYENKIL